MAIELHARPPVAFSISDNLRNFLAQRLSTVEQIEIVLLLMRDPSRAWTAMEVAESLGTAPESAAMRLFLLASGGLLLFEPAGVPRYRYAPQSGETGTLLADLAALYPENRDAFAAQLGGATADPIRSFADAFKLKK